MSRKKSRWNKIDRPVKQPGKVASFWRKKLPLIMIGLAGLIVYANSFQGAFVFDDYNAIRDNPTIRQLFPLDQVLFPEKEILKRGATVEGRPLLNLSFALNYAMGDLEVWSFHAVNLLIHVLAGMTLYGIIRRTMQRFETSGQLSSSSTPWLALVVAIFWVVHPLQTESVTYIVQRAESLVGLLYLLTLYCFIRGIDGTRWWRWGAVALCALGMTAKEVMATAPVMILLYDWVFVSGSVRQMWKERRGFYLTLFSTWAVLAALLLRTGGTNLDILRLMYLPEKERAPLVNILGGTTWWDYALTQFGTVVHYLRLCIWPDPLIVDYGIETAQGFWEIVPAALVVLMLLSATVLGLWRRHWAGYAGAWFFLILAPTTSVVPTNQTLVEHRMYLPLASVLALLVVGGHVAWRGLQMRRTKKDASAETAGWLVSVFMVILIFQALALQTMRRNRDYLAQYTLLRDTVTKRPNNPRAQFNFGLGFMQNKQVDEAIIHFRRASELKSDYADAHYHLGVALSQKDQMDEAIVCLRKALDVNPRFMEAHHELSRALLLKGSLDESIVHSQMALRIKPDHTDARVNLGVALVKKGLVKEGIFQYEFVIKNNPKEVAALNNLAWILAVSPDATLRNGARSLDLAQQAGQISSGIDPRIERTLAAAQAECGEFTEATKIADRALSLALTQSNTELAEKIRKDRDAYQSGKPIRENLAATPSAPCL
ncbi:MAG: tetratricopeptide repeat protein [Verrucomicrobia bacterium]|nr:tetratricopeptide repeat protein [Verrucomicrobiota bacterium]